MSTFDHAGLIQGINESLASFRKAQPDTMRGFAQLAQASMAEGALSSKHKELIALAIGVTQRCSGCIGFHVKALQKLGTTRTELEEMLAVCVYMGGGPALMYTAEALTAWDTLAADNAMTELRVTREGAEGRRLGHRWRRHRLDRRQLPRIRH